MSALPEPHTEGAMVAWMRELARQIRDLATNTEQRFTRQDEQLDRIEDRVGALEEGKHTQEVVGEVLSKRRVRRADSRRHWINTGIAVASALTAGGIGEMIHRIATHHW